MMIKLKNLFSGIICLALMMLVLGCGLGSTDVNNTNLQGGAVDPNDPAAGNTTSSESSSSLKKAYRISGTIDDASQSGSVCDTSVEFTVPGTLEFTFTPTNATKGNYVYSGPFNAKGSGPYEIKDDGTMIVDGTGCIMGKCATYSHKWKAEPIDPATCK